MPRPSSTLFPYTTLFRSVDRFVIVSIFIPKLRLILILNSFLGSSDSLVFSELFRSEERFSRNAETELDTLSLHDALPICGQICHCEHFHPEVAAHSDSEQLLGK